MSVCLVPTACAHLWASAHAQEGQGQHAHLCPSVPQLVVTHPGQCKYAEHVPGRTPTRCARHGAASARSFTFTPGHQSRRLEEARLHQHLFHPNTAPSLPPSFPFSPPTLTFPRCFSWSHQPLFRPDRDSLLPPRSFSTIKHTRGHFPFNKMSQSGP